MIVFIAGDVVPKGISPVLFSRRGEQIFGELKPYITGADISIVNLEAPVVKSKLSPIKKSGPCLSVAPSVVEVLKNAGFSVFSLANNHFFDQGQTGVDDTIDVCNSCGICVMGGGKSYEKARKPLVMGFNDQRVAFINACEHEFSIATTEHGGSNPLDIIDIQKDIETARKEADFVVLILHGGIEQYHFPTPRMKRWYRHFIDVGADVVVNHHQHCINGYEVYRDKPIFYGLGNFYFPWGDSSRPESWYNGYAVRLSLNKQIGFELIPYKHNEEAITLRDINAFYREIEILNEPINDDFLLQQKFDEHLIKTERFLKSQLLPTFLSNRFLLALFNRGFLGDLYKGNTVFNLKNKLTCESHHESLQRLFELQINQNNGK